MSLDIFGFVLLLRLKNQDKVYELTRNLITNSNNLRNKTIITTINLIRLFINEIHNYSLDRTHVITRNYWLR
jgi:hypothetical protein